MKVHDRVPRQLGHVAVRLATAQAREALHGDAVAVGRLRDNGVGDREGAPRLVPPVDRDRLPALRLDRRAGDRPLEAPDDRGGKVAVERVLAGAYADGQATVVLRREQS
jgi:hypothetical protein